MNLLEIRNEIDTLDRQLAGLFARRMELAALVAEEKFKSGQAIENLERENEVLKNVVQEAEAGLEPYIKGLYRAIFILSKAFQAGIINPSDDLRDKLHRALDQGDFFALDQLLKDNKY